MLLELKQLLNLGKFRNYRNWNLDLL